MLSRISRPNNIELMEINGRAFWARPLGTLECRLLDFSDWLDEPAKIWENHRDFVGLKVD